MCQLSTAQTMLLLTPPWHYASLIDPTITDVLLTMHAASERPVYPHQAMQACKLAGLTLRELKACARHAADVLLGKLLHAHGVAASNFAETENENNWSETVIQLHFV